MEKRIAWVLATVAMVGCAQVHAPDEVASGIYELTIERESDACSPSRAVGVMGPVAVLVDGGSIDAPVPDMDAPLLVAPRVRLAPSTLHAETNRRVPGCEGAWVHEEWTVIDASIEGFELLHTQEWQGMSACGAAAEGLPSAPVSDCMSERRLRYDLSAVCAAPCTLQLTASGSVECVCR